MGIFDCFKPHVKQEELPREEQEPLKPPENPLAPASVPAASAPCSALAAEALDGLQAALLSAPAHSWLSRISGLLCAFEDRGMCARLYGLVETASGLTDVDCDLVLIAVGAHAAAASAAALAVVAGAPGFGRRVPGRSSGSTIASATAVEEGVRMELLSQAHNVRAPATRVVYPRDTSAPSPPLAPAGCVTSPSGFRCIHMAAVPLMQGDRMVGALLLEERHTAPATAPVTSETHTSISILSTGLGPSNTHVPASGPRALAATRGNSTLSVFVAASGAAAAAGAATSGHMAPSPAAALLRDTDMLRALSFTASMCLVGSGSDKLLWLAQSVIRLRSAGSLQALVCELVEAVVEHVKRRFILDAYVGVAMVPPAHPQPSGTSAPTSDGSAPATAPSPLPQTEAKALLGLPLRLQPSTGSGAVCDVTGSCLDDAVDGAGETVGGGTGTPSASRRGRRSLLTPQMGRVSAPTVPTSATAAAAAAAVGATPGTAGAGASLAGVATTFNSTSPLRAGPTGEADTAPSLRSISRFFSSLAGGAGAAAGAPNNGGSSHTPRPLSGAHYTAGLGSFAGRNLSAASVVIPLSAADVATVNAAAAGGGTAPAALHANAFPMQHTLLATVLALRQQEAAALRERERLLGIRSTPTVGGGGADTAALPAAAAVTATTSTAAGQAAAAAAAAAATAAVVDDIQLDVQGVHNPNRDVVLLCSVLAQANAAAGAHHPAPNTAAAGSHAAAAAGGPPGGSAAAQKRASTVSGMLAAAITSPIAGPTPNGANGAASGAAVAVTSGNFGTTATAALGSAAPGPPAPPQSLVLLTLSLDRTGASEPGGLVPPVPPSLAGGPAGGSSDAGAALGLYVCFAQRLPAALLEAVRESCQELIDQALAPPFRERLRGPLLAPEYELLKQAQVGTYAVLRGAGLGGPTALEDTHVVPTAVRAGAALLESLLGRSRRLATGGDAGGSMGTALSPSSMLTSSYLTTVDLDVMHAQQQDKTAAEAALRGSSSMRRASLLGMDPRQGDAGHMPGRTAGSSAAAAGQRALRIPSDTTGRSPSMTLARSVTLGLAAGATAASTSPSRIHTPNAGTAAGGEGRALLETGGSGLARTATMPAEDILDLLLGTGDLPTTGTGEGLTPGRSASIIHVTGVEAGGATAHKQMDLLVSSIHATIHASAVRNGATGGTFTSDLEQLELQEVLGRGGGGVVLKGLLNGTLQVAVKLMEMPDVEGEVDAAAAAAAAPPGPDGAPAPAAAPNPAKQLRARRELLRNAMELAVQGSASHPNIVQFYSTFNNVALRSRAAPDEQAGGITDPRSLYLEPAPPVPAETGDNEARVTCILAEYCDAGSLGAALQSRAFPRLARTPVRAAAYGVYSSSFMYDMKGVYMVLLDVALALRHLHSLHLVHRDVKPANLLLKSNPSDYRGFTVKLADFGFVLHLNEKGEDGSRFANVDQACGTVTHMAPECMPGKAKIDASVDIYSFGILCWDLLAGGARPFPHVHPDKIPRMVYKGARPTFSDNVPSAYRTLAQQCWGANPSRRPKANELVTIITQQLQAL